MGCYLADTSDCFFMATSGRIWWVAIKPMDQFYILIDLTAWPPYSCPSSRWRSLWVLRSNTCSSGSRKNWKAKLHKLRQKPKAFLKPERRCSRQTLRVRLLRLLLRSLTPGARSRWLVTSQKVTNMKKKKLERPFHWKLIANTLPVDQRVKLR